MLESHIPVVEYSRNGYSIKCPRCNKPITLQELIDEEYCRNCYIPWNKTAKALELFYYTHSEELFRMYKRYWGDLYGKG